MEEKIEPQSVQLVVINDINKQMKVNQKQSTLKKNSNQGRRKRKDKKD